MANNSLTPEQYIAIHWLAQPKKGGKTFEEIAELCGEVHSNTIYNWRRNPAFDRELKREIMRSTLSRLPEVMESVPDHIIRNGNAAMLKTLLQANDMLTDKVEVTTVTSDGKDLEAIKAKLAEAEAKFTMGE